MPGPRVITAFAFTLTFSMLANGVAPAAVFAVDPTADPPEIPVIKKGGSTITGSSVEVENLTSGDRFTRPPLERRAPVQQLPSSSLWTWTITVAEPDQEP